MRVFLTIYLLCLPLSAIAADLDNWYFKFISVERKVTGEIFSPAGKLVGTFTGKASGKASADGKEFTEKFEYVYWPEKDRMKDSLVWIKDENGIFHASAEIPAGKKFTSELTIKAENQYLLKTTYEDGRTCESTAELREDGILYAVDIAKDKKGDVVFTLQYKRS